MHPSPHSAEPRARPGSATVDDCIRVFGQELDYVLRTLQRLGASSADAEDLAQEVFLVMWRRRRDWNPDTTLRPWLAAIAYRVTLAHRRRSVREVPAGLLDAEDGGRALEEQIAADRARRAVLRALAALPPRNRIVLIMHELDGVPMKAVARSLDLPLFTAYSRLRVARIRFAKEIRRLQKLGGERVLPPLPAIALLDLERPLPPLEAARRRWLQARARRALERTPTGVDRIAGRWGGVAAGLTAVASVLLIGLGARTVFSRGSAAAATASSTATSAPATATRPGRQALAALPRRRPAAPALRAAGGSWAAEALAAGVAAYLRFDEPRGAATARDLSAAGSECILRRIDSTDWIDGTLGKALRLSGGGWLECPAGPGLRRITDQITISGWVLHARAQKHLRTIVSRQHGTGNQDEIYLGLIGKRLIFSSRTWGRMTAPIPPLLNRWFHVAVVGEASGTLHLYLDGAEIARGAGTRARRLDSDPGAPFDNPLLIGAAVNGPDPSFVDQKLDGAVDELLIYDRALGPREIAQLAGGTQPGL